MQACMHAIITYIYFYSFCQIHTSRSLILPRQIFSSWMNLPIAAILHQFPSEVIICCGQVWFLQNIYNNHAMSRQGERVTRAHGQLIWWLGCWIHDLEIMVSVPRPGDALCWVNQFILCCSGITSTYGTLYRFRQHWFDRGSEQMYRTYISSL